jgi:hypothetical protein
MGAMTSRYGLLLALAMLVAGAAAVRPLVEQAVAADDSRRNVQGKEEKLNLRPIIGIISQVV